MIGDMSEIAALRDVANGNAGTAFALARYCLDAVDRGEADPLIGTIEALTFARIAGATGDLKGLGCVISTCARLVDILDGADCQAIANHYRAEAIAISDLAADTLPLEESDFITSTLTLAADKANPETMQIAAMHRDTWAEAFTNP